MYNPEQPAKYVELELLVDTGAIHTIIPPEAAEKLEIKSRGKRKFRLADGTVIERDYGVGMVEIRDEVGGATIVFGKENDIPVIGVTTLEAVGLEVDPLTGELKPMELLLL